MTRAAGEEARGFSSQVAIVDYPLSTVFVAVSRSRARSGVMKSWGLGQKNHASDRTSAAPIRDG